MTTLEKAKRFYKAIERHFGTTVGSLELNHGLPWNSVYDEIVIETLQKQNRAYRALLKQRLKTVESEDWYDDGPQSGYEAGLKEALELHDAVHGRSEDGK